MAFYQINPQFLLAIGQTDVLWQDDESVLDFDQVKQALQQTTSQAKLSQRLHSVSRSERSIRRRIRPECESMKSHQSFSIAGSSPSAFADSYQGSPSSSSTSSITLVASSTQSFRPVYDDNTGRVQEVFDSEGDLGWSQTSQYQTIEEPTRQPKLEPLDESDMEDCYELLDTSPMDNVQVSVVSVEQPPKRPRGRPRKNPKPGPEELARIKKGGRTKTGCMRCRDRKKKCDEMKPFCNNCQKNSLECPGYPPLKVFQSRAEKKAEEQRIRALQKGAQQQEDIEAKARDYAIPSFKLPHIILGIETEGDRIFFKHYTNHLSARFTAEEELDSAFRRIVLPVAQNDSGLMHSILSLASKHINYGSAYGRKLLADHPNVNVAELQARSQYHHDEAIKELVLKQDREDNIPAVLLQIVCQILETLSNPNPKGEHRLHLYALLKIKSRPMSSMNIDVERLVDEFYGFHVQADQAMIHPNSGYQHKDFVCFGPEPAGFSSRNGCGQLFGPASEDFLCSERITKIRNVIRKRLETFTDPTVDYPILHEVLAINQTIRDWAPEHGLTHSQHMLRILFKHTSYVHLFRTVYPPQHTNWVPDARITKAVDEGLSIVGPLLGTTSVLTLLLNPVFMLGCAAFEQGQREKVKEAILVIQDYMQFQNTITCMKLLTQLWKLMDRHDPKSWDWEAVALEMGMEFLAT